MAVINLIKYIQTEGMKNSDSWY